ncbi:unnamed protein product, partial [Sphenostylis stenocarpa]
EKSDPGLVSQSYCPEWRHPKKAVLNIGTQSQGESKLYQEALTCKPLDLSSPILQLLDRDHLPAPTYPQESQEPGFAEGLGLLGEARSVSVVGRRWTGGCAARI